MMENKINPLQKSQVKFNLDIHAIKEFSEKKKLSEKIESISEEKTAETEKTQNNLNNEKQAYQKDKKEKSRNIEDIQNCNLPDNKEIIAQSKNYKNLNDKNNLQSEINKKNINFFQENSEKLKPKINQNLPRELFRNQHNFNNFQYNQINKPFGLNHFNSNNIYNFNINNNNLIQNLIFIKELKLQFEKLKELGLLALKNPNNINNYLLNSMILNNNISNYANSYINNNNPFNNNINYYFNFYGHNLLNNCLQNQNIMNMNVMNNLNSITNSINPKNYTITFKSKTDDPTINKISKIKITTTYVKDNNKIKSENKTQVPKEKKPKNIINIEDIKSGIETRTVVRLNPIPPNFSSFDVSKLLDKYLKIENGKNQRIYKALYTPLCKVIGKNLGYCFVMMASPKYVIDFYKTFNGTTFGLKKCYKPCNVIWADFQGEDFLKLNKDDPIRKPIIFKDIKND